MYQKILLLGAPGSGKGTQAKFLVAEYGHEHVSTGDILRAEVASSSELGLEAKQYMDQGALVPNDIVNQMVLKKIKSLERNPFLFDGYPRTVNQAEFLNENNIQFDLVLFFYISLEAVLDRMSGRLTCKTCGSSFHAKYNPPAVDMVCDQCQAQLIIRDDDKPETVKKRFETYQEQTKPLLEYYSKIPGLVQQINAEDKIENIQKKIKSYMEK